MDLQSWQSSGREVRVFDWTETPEKISFHSENPNSEKHYRHLPWGTMDMIVERSIFE